MHITLDEFEQMTLNEEFDRNFEYFANELNESLGTLKQVSSNPDYLFVVQKALKRKVAPLVSTKSTVSAIRGSTIDDFLKDVKNSKNKGTFGFIYVETANGTQFIVNEEPYELDKVGLTTAISFVTISNSQYTGQDIDVRKNQNWSMARFKAYRIRDVGKHLDLDENGYKGFIVFNDPTLQELRWSRQLSQRTKDKYEPSEEGSFHIAKGETPFYSQAKKQAVANRAAKINVFPAVEKMTWADLKKLSDVSKSWSGKNVAVIGDVNFTFIRGDVAKPGFRDDSYTLFLLQDENDDSYRLFLDFKGLHLEKK